MELSQPGTSFKRYKVVVLVIAVFCVADVCVHYWNSSTVHHVVPASLSPLELLPEFLEPEANVTSRLANRLSRYKEVCSLNQDSIKRDMDKLSTSKMYTKYYINQQRVVIDSKSMFAVCLQAKGGSSFWKHLFQHKKVSADGELIYSETKLNPMGYIQFVSLNKFKTAVDTLSKQNYTLFTFGRNPWYRLVSLYRQKIEGKELNHTAYRYVKAACLKMPCDTFQELLECVLQTWSLGFPDRHWEPLTAHCGLCTVPYHYIGRTELMNEEASHILTIAGAKGNTSAFLQTTRSNSMREVEQKSAHVDYKSYYSDIPASVIQRLKDMYKHDISLLGYPDNPLL